MTADGLLERGLLLLRERDPVIDRLIGGSSAEVLALLNKYIEEIELFNPAYGLVGAKNRQDLVVRHILDSLSALGIMGRLLGTASPAPPLIADLGSGAGLPGIPLAVVLSNWPFVLMERSGRRAGFLWNTLAVLGLSNAVVEEEDMEQAAPERFGLITFRAFRPLEPAPVKSLFRLLRHGGVLAAYKGRRDTIEAELAGLTDLEDHLKVEIHPLFVPFLEEERHLVVLKPRRA
ncbi:MAG: 16S rRNA (guanine(527)-N(7))-methyltransferase RsmG [Spirochaetaceae bacterium]|jgi:16S rRNA (guanine527-N7)-methyltransferase|nr:16S rRNA (guanine(527)-N(7))-methyltransferase RsmG [Spirochaetaceae bacterium]